MSQRSGGRELSGHARRRAEYQRWAMRPAVILRKPPAIDSALDDGYDAEVVGGAVVPIDPNDRCPVCGASIGRPARSNRRNLTDAELLEQALADASAWESHRCRQETLDSLDSAEADPE